ncbi:unnamed protein product [Ectocarpus sp. 4 AP-2014]
MFLPGAAGAFMAESGKVDDESLSKEAPTKCPNYNLEDPTRRIWVFTTASLPWMTGTAVNPLLRAAYLTRGRDKGKVTLGVPWLVDEDQEKVYPKGKRYAAREDQEAYVREWLVKAGLEEESKKLDILFYPARYHEQFGSIFPMGDLAAQAPDEEADVAVLEEPEHLNFFRAEGVPWLKKFNYVVGIIHTNYQFYARGEKHGLVKKPIVNAACAFTVRAHCHRIIKLSDTLQGYAREKEMVENVHGVRPQFFEVGDEAVKKGFTDDAYFIGKVRRVVGAKPIQVSSFRRIFLASLLVLFDFLSSLTPNAGFLVIHPLLPASSLSNHPTIDSPCIHLRSTRMARVPLPPFLILPNP